ncbi:CoA ester lyase [Rhodococcus sp. 05-2254-6]|uniref:HpcH/HpaI aldolase/citrate lyase family protein n=1 Tax=Nocardiaceae TaxID=85025 RepID=UPI00055BB6E0|nr:MULTISPECIES: CoA ester lyase [Rhodococcus]OZE28894.1 CoA ester lyase [Rhodococcus sp. 05-2254-6]OZE89209.1 CoA ester lyase [Rhodococcus sp. 15-2388-1-1a]
MRAADAVGAARTFLFVPASRPELFRKAHAAGADVVILDLEDAVAPSDKGEALRAVEEWLTRADAGVDGALTMVRINAHGTRWHGTEVRAMRGGGAAIMVPKADSASRLASLHRELSAPLVPLIETPRGVVNSESIAAADGVSRLALGHMDLAVALGVDPDCRDAFRHTRSQLVLASAASGLASPVDGVTASIDDTAQLADDVAHALALGLGAKLCIHPRQIGAVHDALRPSPDESAWATKVLEMIEAQGVDDDGGAVALDGKMIDPPVIARARAIVARVYGTV